MILAQSRCDLFTKYDTIRHFIRFIHTHNAIEPYGDKRNKPLSCIMHKIYHGHN